MAKRGGMYNANKRKKELQRKKKQEEKRLKRQKGIPEKTDPINPEPESSETPPE